MRIVRCAACGKAYRVGERRPRSFTCGCGATVDLARDDVPGQPGATRSAEENAERRALSREVGKALRFLRAARTLYAVAAGFLAVIVVMSVLGGAFGFLAVILAAIVAVFVVGVLQLERNPVPWATVMALLYSVGVAAAVVARIRKTGHLAIGLGELWTFAVVAALWSTVSFAKRAQRIVDAHPDLWVARRLRGHSLEDERPGASTRHRDVAREERVRSLRTSLLIGAGAFGVLLLVGFVATRMREASAPAALPTPSVPVDGAVARFEAAWAAAAWADAAALRPADERERKTRIFMRSLESRGWAHSPPALGAPRVEVVGDAARVTYRIHSADGEIELRTEWEWNGSAWEWVLFLLREP